MSSSHSIVVTCPECRHEQPYSAWGFIEAAQNPELKEKLLAGALTRLVCAKCGAERDALYPLLYHDARNRLAIWLLPGDDMPDDEDDTARPSLPDVVASYHFRLVRSLNALKEKVVIADAGLDDRVVELLKISLRQDPETQIQPADAVLFAGLEEEDSQHVAVFAVLRGTEQFAFSIPYGVVARFADEAQTHAEALFKSADRWLRVDEASTAKRISDLESE